jgi:hypothetical protein
VSANMPDDRDLEALLAETSALRQQYRVASHMEPPLALDDAIRAAARREVGARPRTTGSGFGGSWRIPTSIAAVVVVSVTVAMMVSLHNPQSLVTSQRPSLGAPAEVGVPNDQNEPARGARAAKEQSKVEADKTAPQVRPSAAVLAPSTPAPVESSIERAERADLAAKIESHVARTTAERDEPPRVQAARTPALPAAADASAPARAANATAAPSTAPEAAAEATADGGVSGQPLTKKRATSNFAQAESKDSPWEKDPQTWLEHIEELRAAGRMHDAEASFRAFRDRYPDYQLPAGFVAPLPAVSN